MHYLTNYYCSKALHWIRSVFAVKWLRWIHVSSNIWSELFESAANRRIASAIYTKLRSLGSQTEWEKHWIGSEYDVMSRDQSRDFEIVSIHNVSIYMTSDDVIVSGVDAIVSVGDIVHIR